MIKRKIKTLHYGLLALLIGYFEAFSTGYSETVRADPINFNAIQKIRTLKTHLLFGEEFYTAGKPDLSGVAFPPGAHTLLMFKQSAAGAGDSIVLVAPPKGEKIKALRTVIDISDPINIAFDTASQGARGFGLYRLFLLDTKVGQLIAVKANARDVMDPAKIGRFEVRGFGITNPQGMTIDPFKGRLYVLDASGPRIVAIDPEIGRDFGRAKHVEIKLPRDLGTLRGIAFNPSDKHLYVANPQQQKLYKLTSEGMQVASYNFIGQQPATLQGMIFAPSLDNTDHPSVFHLYMAINEPAYSESSEWELADPLVKR